MKVGDPFIFIYDRKFQFCKVESMGPMTKLELSGPVSVPSITIRMLFPDEGELRQFSLTSQYYKRFEALIKGDKKGRISKRQVVRGAFKLSAK